MNDVQPLYVLAACLCAGAAAGILYEGNCLFRFFCPRKGAAIAADVLFFFLFACTYAAAAALFRLPSFRLYMGAAALAGFFLYLESLHRILAFLAKRLYNTVRSGRKKIAVGVRRWKKIKKSAS